MTDREKLIYILMDELPEEHPLVGNVRGLVDILIANGVVVREKPQTNADRIRAMSDEELAWELMVWRFDAYSKAKGDESTLPSSQKTILDWLKQPVEDGEDDG